MCSLCCVLHSHSITPRSLRLIALLALHFLAASMTWTSMKYAADALEHENLTRHIMVSETSRVVAERRCPLIATRSSPHLRPTPLHVRHSLIVCSDGDADRAGRDYRGRSTPPCANPRRERYTQSGRLGVHAGLSSGCVAFSASAGDAVPLRAQVRCVRLCD